MKKRDNKIKKKDYRDKRRISDSNENVKTKNRREMTSEKTKR